MNAETIKIECDEDGFWLAFDVADGAACGKFRAHITDPEALYDAVRATIEPWLMERNQAKAAFDVREYRVTEDGGLEAYDISDPKHPDYHSVHADLWDSREGK